MSTLFFDAWERSSVYKQVFLKFEMEWANLLVLIGEERGNLALGSSPPWARRGHCSSHTADCRTGSGGVTQRIPWLGLALLKFRYGHTGHSVGAGTQILGGPKR